MLHSARTGCSGATVLGRRGARPKQPAAPVGETYRLGHDGVQPQALEVRRAQVDGSYDGKPANFVAANGKIAQPKTWLV